MSRAKNQHWVPQFYLRHFATPETRGKDQAQVWVFSIDERDGHEKLTNVRNICSMRYLYTPVDESGKRIWGLETMLGTLEHSLADIWPALATGYKDLKDADFRKAVSLFLAIMHLRSPDNLRAVEGIHRQLVTFFEGMPKDANGFPDVDSIESAGKVRSFETSDWPAYRAWGKHDHHRFFARMIRSEAVHLAEFLLNKRWSIIFGERDAFITTDRPVVVAHRSKRCSGFATRGAIVSFPISPTRLLILDDIHDEPANQYYPLKTASSGAFNYHLWRNSSRFMITGRPVQEVLAELVAWTESLPMRDGGDATTYDL